MAKRSYYSRRKSSTGRKLFLTVVMIAVVAAAAYRLLTKNGNGTPPNNGTPSRAAAKNTVTPEPPVIPPKPLEEATAQTSDNPIRPEPQRKSNPVAAVVRETATQQAVKLLTQAQKAIARQDYIAARDLLSDAIKTGLAPDSEIAARKLVNQVSDKWLLSKNIFESDQLCKRYKVASGQELVNIGRKHNVPYQLLMKINKIDKPQHLQAGEWIKVIDGPFHAEVDRKRFMLSVYLQDVLVRSYPVGLGKAGRSTPMGLWLVAKGKKVVNPAWRDEETGEYYYPDDPQNPLGERWIGLDGLDGDAKERTGFGIHGTSKPEEIGRAASRGCVRLYNGDVEELYDMLTEGLSQVRIVE